MYNKLEQSIRVFLWGTEIGTLSWNQAKGNTYFFFSPDYFQEKYDIAPLTYPKDKASSRYAILGLNGNFGDPRLKIYQSLPPFLADSLPDSWGNMVFERWFKSRGLKESDKTPVAKLAFIGERAIGAFEFKPCYDIPSCQRVDLSSLYNEALVYQNTLQKKTIQVSDVISVDAFAGMGTSLGGRQMKVTVSVDNNGDFFSGHISGRSDMRSCILKFNTPRYSLCEIEKTYYDLACLCGIKMMPSELIFSKDACHFLTERFDRQGGNKVFTQTLAAINPDANTYEDLFSTCTRLGLNYIDKEELFRRTVFNFLLNNTDDHVKNFSFLMERNGTWNLSPAYDMNFVISANGIVPEVRHCIPIMGKVSGITKEDLLKFGRLQSIKNPGGIIDKVIEAAKCFPELARKNRIGDFFADMIANRISDLCGTKISMGIKPLIITSQTGDVVKNIVFLLNEKEDHIILQAEVNGTERKVYFSKNKLIFKKIMDNGMNNMGEDLKRQIIHNYIFSNMDLPSNKCINNSYGSEELRHLLQSYRIPADIIRELEQKGEAILDAKISVSPNGRPLDSAYLRLFFDKQGILYACDPNMPRMAKPFEDYLKCGLRLDLRDTYPPEDTTKHGLSKGQKQSN